MKNILVPIDCSAATPGVLDLARQLATAFQAELHLIHVRELPSALPTVPLGYGALGMPEMAPLGGMSFPVVETAEGSGSSNDDRQARLAQWQQEIQRAGLKVTLQEPAGDVLDEILQRAAAVKADAIVMGRHGHGAMYNLLVGSVTEGVLKRSALPVLLVPTSDHAKS